VSPVEPVINAALIAEVQFGREICGDLDAAEKREWLVTNGLGGFASGTVAGTATRRYHGLLIAALQPPVARTLLVAGLDESVRYQDNSYSLATNRWASGFVSPSGYLQLESFYLEGAKPVWRYALTDALLEKRIWMKQGENTTYVQYTLVRGAGPVQLDGKVLVSYRGFHETTRSNGWKLEVESIENGLRVVAYDGAVPFVLKSSSATFQPHQEWYRDYILSAELARGLDDKEDRFYAGQFRSRLEVGQSVTLVFSTEPNTSLDGQIARDQQSSHERKLFQAWQKQHAASGPSQPAEDEPGWLWQLVLAADQFIVKRALPKNADGRSIIAGYHWFGDWGRDTMIALPGLTLTVGRPEIAREILESHSRYVDGGMLPNCFADVTGAPEYNTVDATLWYFQAIRQYFEATKDLKLIRDLFPILAGIVDAHVRGTRFNIKVDPVDGLLFAGTPQVQLTWMDAKVGDWVVTPRTGKPVEINALWINALQTMKDFATALAQPFDGYEKLAAKATKNFERFWNAEGNCCFDVIDVPGGVPGQSSNVPGTVFPAGSDPSIRPNQILAVALPTSPLSARQQKGVVDVCAQQLLTSYGLRSLAPSDPNYKGRYGGGVRERDSAYHQGTVWGWLLGSFALAHFRVYGDRRAAQSFLDPLGRSIYAAGLGTISEIFEGDAPHVPSGAIAQAWSVAELFRAWQFLGSTNQTP
jgi:predicted glycogen debranching enzyme